MDAFRHNLPGQLTPLIGRETEIAEVGRLVADERLVTLTGSGGVGKTRLGLAVAADAIDWYPGGVWLVELAGVSDPGGVPAAALAAVGARRVGAGRRWAARDGAGWSALPVGAGQLRASSRRLCRPGRRVCWRQTTVLTVVATSREPLGVPGEVIWRVPSLGAPPADTPVAVPALSQYDAVRLFVDRARRARPSFSVSDANAAAIAQICYRLDGIPLALELAAARCRQLTAERIARDLDDRFRLLTGRPARRFLASRPWSLPLIGATSGWTRRSRSCSAAWGCSADCSLWRPPRGSRARPGDLDPVEMFDIMSRLVDKNMVQCHRQLRTVTPATGSSRRCAPTPPPGPARKGELSQLQGAHTMWWLAWLEDRWPVAHTDVVVGRRRAVSTAISKPPSTGAWPSPPSACGSFAALGRPLLSTGLSLRHPRCRRPTAHRGKHPRTARQNGSAWPEIVGPLVLLTLGHRPPGRSKTSRSAWPCPSATTRPAHPQRAANHV